MNLVLELKGGSDWLAENFDDNSENFGTEKKSLWAQVISAKYGYASSDWLPLPNHTLSYSRIWGDICSMGDDNSDIASITKLGFWIKVCSGADTSFWNDIWLGPEALKYTFHRLYLISDQKSARVIDLFDIASQSWSFTFRRDLYDWEEDYLIQFRTLLLNFKLDNGVDSLKWRWNPSAGQYSVKSWYNRWEERYNNLNLIGESCNLIWNSLNPLKTQIFVWQAMQESLPTASELIRRNIKSMDENFDGLCPFCGEMVESASHVLLHCKIAWSIWSDIIDWWKLKWVCPGSISSLIFWWPHRKKKFLKQACWSACFFATIWSIWLARNDVVFNDKALVFSEITDLIKTRVAIWIKANFDLQAYSVESFKLNLSSIISLKVPRRIQM